MSERVFEEAHAVVANPPFIRCDDPSLKDAYRKRYVSAYMNFGLGVPFTERLFQLAVPGGYVGEITSNAFIKREHGKRLVEDVLPKLDLTHVIDTSGAYIPGHGTPTVILFGRNRPPTRESVSCVLHKRGEPSIPEGANPPAHKLLKSRLDSVLRELAKCIRHDHGVGQQEATRSAGAWILTSLMAMTLEARRILTRPLPWSDGFEAVFDVVRDYAPESEWFDPDPEVSHNPRCGLPFNPEWQAWLKRDLDLLTPPSPADAFGRSGWANPDTDWIGDLWQAFDSVAVKKHAFCQTPRFVRDLILKHTLDPALAEFGVDGIRVLDPACGAGHFLVDAFWRIYQRHADPPDGPPEHTYIDAARRALESVRGADINPAVVNLTRFRLMLAYCDATMARSVNSYPYDCDLRVTVADALLDGPQKPSPPVFEAPPKPRVVQVDPKQPKQLTLFGEVA